MHKDNEKINKTETEANKVLTLGNYTIQFYKKNKSDPFEMIAKIYELSRDATCDSYEKNRDLKAIVREYLE